MNNAVDTKQYSYDGPVAVDGICCANQWSATTMATTEKKARANFIYRFKKENGIYVGARVDLPGKITVAN